MRIVLAAGVLLSALVAFAAYKVHRRTQFDPTFCSSACHHKRDDAGDWHTKGHEGVDCQRCHQYPGRLGAKLLWQSMTGAAASPVAHGKPEARACTACHERSPVEWRLIAATQGHREHRALKDIDCLSCHAKEMHKTQSAEKHCLTCHKEQRLHKQTATAETCLSCHSFAVSKKNAQKPTALACEQCHADQTNLAASVSSTPVRSMRTVDKHALHGEIDCKLCHNPHGKKPKVLEGQPTCARCHQFETLEIGGMAVPKGPAGHRECEKCHQPHAPLKRALDQCITCHEKKVAPAAIAGTKPTALRHQSCASCHQPHSWKAQRSGCMQCHEDKASLLLTKSPEPHKACDKCHEVHGPAPTGAVCVTCHIPKRPHVAKAPARHKDCTSCHEPHSPLPNDTKGSCAKCHVSQLSQVMRDGPAGHSKEGCYGCHKPHENPLPPADLCGKCHGEKAKAVATAGPPKHKVCSSCHEPHRFKIAEPAAACGKCHGQVIQAGGPHQGDCKKCHTLHGSPTVQTSACFQCHAPIQAAFKPPNEQHGKCKSCHQPHRAASTAPAKCETCHQAKAQTAKAWPAGSAHAKACSTCHQPHDVRTKKACAECHKNEAASASGGKHQCQQCHPPHKEPPGQGVAWWTRCQSCHTAQVQGVKTRGPKHSECRNCHQPHKFAIPGCTSCHTGMQEKGAHGVKEHAAKCNACHNPHTSEQPTRAQCLACHTNKQSHQPEAQRCQACHPFQ